MSTRRIGARHRRHDPHRQRAVRVRVPVPLGVEPGAHLRRDLPGRRGRAHHLVAQRRLRNLGTEVDHLRQDECVRQRCGRPPRPAPALRLAADPNRTNVFVPLLLGAGVLVSAVAWLVERIARATASPMLERDLSRRLGVLSIPSPGLPHRRRPGRPRGPPVRHGELTWSAGRCGVGREDLRRHRGAGAGRGRRRRRPPGGHPEPRRPPHPRLDHRAHLHGVHHGTSPPPPTPACRCGAPAQARCGAAQQGTCSRWAAAPTRWCSPRRWASTPPGTCRAAWRTPRWSGCRARRRDPGLRPEGPSTGRRPGRVRVALRR